MMASCGHLTTACVLVLVSVMASPVWTSAPYEKWPTPPKWTAKPQMARYLVQHGFWGVVAAFSPVYKSPFGTIQSYSDGPVSNSTGIPYFYIASISDTYQNLAYNNSVSFTITMAESMRCREVAMDPEEPPCSRVTLVGKIVKIKLNTEKKFAKKSLFKRHPAMASWPSAHDWNFYKLDIKAVHLLDYYGGATHVPLKDYFAAAPQP